MPARVGQARRDAIVAYVREFHASHGYGPSLREVAAAVGLRGTGGIGYQVAILVTAGALAMEANIPRSLRVVEMHSRSES